MCVEGIFSSYHLSLITWKQFASRIWKLKKCCENIIMSTIMYCIRSNIILVKMCKILSQIIDMLKLFYSLINPFYSLAVIM